MLSASKSLLFRYGTTLAFVLSSLSAAYSQSTNASSSTPKAVATEIWFGWLETPKQHLRTILRLGSNPSGNQDVGFILSPDQTPDSLPLTNLQIDATDGWQFTVENPAATNRSATYKGKQVSTLQVDGELEQNGVKLPLSLTKIDRLPTETTRDLGADEVWLGTLDLVVRKMDFRIRVYSKPPFGHSDKPRVLFDSLTQNANGIPVEATVDGETHTFDMKSLQAKFVGTMNATGTEIEGRFLQGPLPLQLVMKRQSNEISNSGQTQKREMRQPSQSREKASSKELEPSSSPHLQDETSPSDKTARTVSTEFYEETPFHVNFGSSKPRPGKTPTTANKGITLSGTLTIPKRKEGVEQSKFAAVVMVSGSGPQDRNETIGRHKPFEVIAHDLAKNGIASLRYDDRGVGESTGDFLNATSEDFAKDALEVWAHAKTVPEIDASKIGILGHSEGGLVGPIAAVWEPGIAFLILIAPPGVTGSEILTSQIDRMAELQGMSESDRKATMRLQSKLQDLASGYFTDDAKLSLDIQNAVNQGWDSIKSIAKEQNPKVDLDQARKDLTTQIEGQLQQLRMPWYKFFLKYDPSPNWMMLRCPTLALWGSNDVQVLPELNIARIKLAIARNPRLDAQFVVLPGLNHLMQKSESGLPDEYERIDETVSADALKAIRTWALGHGLIAK
jgi:uncharacterized protein